MRPFSGMTGYGWHCRLCFSRQWRIARCGAYCWTLTVRAGRPPARLHCADMIYRLRQQKPVWALCNDTACSAAMRCWRRLLPTAGYPDIRIGSHWRDDEPCQLCRASGTGRCGYHADFTQGRIRWMANQFEALPAEVRQDMQKRIDAAHRMFAEKVRDVYRLSVDCGHGNRGRRF